jgi:hypothetical protein
MRRGREAREPNKQLRQAFRDFQGPPICYSHYREFAFDKFKAGWNAAVATPTPEYTQSLIDWLLMPPAATPSADEERMRRAAATHLHLLSNRGRT